MILWIQHNCQTNPRADSSVTGGLSEITSMIFLARPVTTQPIMGVLSFLVPGPFGHGEKILTHWSAGESKSLGRMEAGGL